MRLFNKWLLPNKVTPLDGGLIAELHVAPSRYGRSLRYSVEVKLRTRGAGDLIVLLPEYRETAQAAAKHTEETLTHLASALRQAGAH